MRYANGDVLTLHGTSGDRDTYAQYIPLTPAEVPLATRTANADAVRLGMRKLRLPMQRTEWHEEVSARDATKSGLLPPDGVAGKPMQSWSGIEPNRLDISAMHGPHQAEYDTLHEIKHVEQRKNVGVKKLHQHYDKFEKEADYFAEVMMLDPDEELPLRTYWTADLVDDRESRAHHSAELRTEFAALKSSAREAGLL